MTINGVINLNKRPGISSFKAVREVRTALNEPKAGHTGTLDPEASGVLPVCLGKATRIVDYLMKTEKEYKVSMFIGISTVTCDLEGEISSSKSTADLNNNEILNAVNSFKGKLMQVPPIYSAIKVNGRKLYEYALKGQEVEIKPREIEIYYINNIEVSDYGYKGNEVKLVNFTAGCSKGTYIRSLCRDIGEKLNNYGVMSALVRTMTGGFRIEDSYTIDEIMEKAESGDMSGMLIPPEEKLNLQILQLDKSDFEDYINGRKVVITSCMNDEYLIKSYTGEVIGIGIVDDTGGLKSRKRLI